MKVYKQLLDLERINGTDMLFTDMLMLYTDVLMLLTDMWMLFTGMWMLFTAYVDA